MASGNGTPYAAFAGYTTALAGYVSVFNPASPTTDTMTNQSACFRQEGSDYPYCPVEMYGANAPGSTWHMTFDSANLDGSQDFAQVPSDSALWNGGNGQVVVQPAKPAASRARAVRAAPAEQAEQAAQAAPGRRRDSRRQRARR